MILTRWWVIGMVLAGVLAGCGAQPETPEPAAPLPTASLLPTGAPAPEVTAPEPDAYEQVEIVDAALALAVPAGWERLVPEWSWSPDAGSGVRIGVQWADLAPPLEAEAVLLPGNAQVLAAQEVDLAWGRARQLDVEVYVQSPQGGAQAPVQSVERHVLVVVGSGNGRRAYDFYASAPTAEALEPVTPVLDRMVASADITVMLIEGSESPVPTAPMPALGTPLATPPQPPQPQMEVVQVFFGNMALNPNAQDCSAAYPVERQVPAVAHRLDAALNELFAGPTPAELAEGYTSWFSLDTANLLLDAFVQGDTAYVNLGDLRPLIPSASSSCGSAQLLAQMGQTAQAAVPGVRRVLYAIEGQPQPFYEWLQLGCDEMNDFCDPAPFQGN